MVSVASNIKTNRGHEIMNGGQFILAKGNINVFKQNEKIMPQLVPIIEKLAEKIENFEENGQLNWLHAVKWCIDHELIQEGITQLHEGIETYLCNLEKIHFSVKEERKKVSEILIGISNPNIPFEFDENMEDKELYKSLAFIYNSLRNTRNDINHSGYLKTSGKAVDFKKNLIENYIKVKELCS